MKKRNWFWLTIALAAGGLYYFPKLHLAEKFAPRIKTELEQALGRKVKFDKVSFNVLSGLGFAVDEVVIHDDPANDIEPIAYVSSLEMRVRLLSLLSGELSFSGLRLVEPSVNLKHTPTRGWNVQQLMNQVLASAGKSRPGLAIQVRSGRVNFKSNDQKSVFYITDADVDIESSSRSTGGFDIVFSGAPARTDRAAQGFGRLTGRGEFRPGAQGDGEVELSVKLQKSSVGEIAVLTAGRDLGIHGLIAAEAKLTGPLSAIQIAGHAELSDIHRWDLMGSKSEGWPVDFQGMLDFRNQAMNIQTLPGTPPNAAPVSLRIAVHNYLSAPRWAALITVKNLSADPLLAVARHMGAGVPEKLAMDGKVEGVLGYTSAAGFQGGVRMNETTAKSPDDAAILIPAAQIKISGYRAEMLPARFELPQKRHADLEAAIDFETQQVELKITTPGLAVRDTDIFTKLLSIDAAPVIKLCDQGIWRGTLRYDKEWKGDAEISATQLTLPDLADKLEISSAWLQIRGERFNLSRLRGKAGQIAFEGEFQWLPAALHPARLRIHARSATGDELDRLLAPILRRQQGFIARTLRLDRAPVPDWLTSRHAEGSVEIDTLTMAGRQLDGVKLALSWDAIQASLKNMQCSVDDYHASGSMTADLTYALPIYKLTASLEGDAIALGQDVQAQSISGEFAIKAQRGAPNLAATNLELIAGKETYTGKGGTMQDGKLQFELLSGKKPLRLGGTLSPLALEILPPRTPN